MRNSRIVQTAILTAMVLIGWSCSTQVGTVGTDAFVVDIQTGLDSNPGTPERPFKTIQRAQTAVGQTLAGGMQGDVVVQIRPGQYYLQSPLVFDHRDSGRNGYRVIYRGTGDRQPKLISGTPLAGRELYKDGIYKTPLPNGVAFNNLMENNTLGMIAVGLTPGNPFKDK